MKVFFTALALLTILTSRGQNPNGTIEVARMQFQAKQVIPPAPEAAALGKFGNVPVSLFTGTPNVSIPLASLSATSFSVPVSLSYNASGFKPEEIATWVGFGWSLNGGGVVTRAVRGNPDDEENYFGVTGVLTPPNPADLFNAYFYMKDIQDGIIETQPDVYYYNFNGQSGKFVLRPDYTVVKKEENQLSITPCISSSCGTNKFTIVDEQGITYVFSSNETTRVVPNDNGDVPSSTKEYDYVSAWYLTQIYAPDGVDLVEFEYHSFASEQPVTRSLLSNYSYNLTYGCKGQPGCFNLADANGSHFSTPPETFHQRKILKKITLKRNSVLIAYIDLVSADGSTQREDSDDGQDRRLNQVKVYSVVNGSDILTKQYDLKYDYFGAGATGPYAFLDKRLRLDTLKEISLHSSATSPPPHIFTYDVSSATRFTRSIDHWGFYNGQSNSTGIVPDYAFPGIGLAPCGGVSPQYIGSGANREANLSTVEATLLKKITYPTGGYTTFEYELNKARTPDGVTHDVGGARIKQMIDYSFTSQKATVKNYRYELADNSISGVIGAWPDYVSTSTYYHHSYNSVTCEEVSNYELTTISVSTNSVYALGTQQGSHIGYSQVTEYSIDLATSEPLGKTVYNYSTGQYFEYDEDVRSGNLLKKSVYRNDDKLLEQTSSGYAYTDNYDIEGQIVKSQQAQSNKKFYCKVGTNSFTNHGFWESPSCPLGYMEIPTNLYLVNYPLNIQTRKLITDTTRIYEPVLDRYLTTVKNYTYGSSAHDYITKIEETTTNGEKVITEMKYAPDYANAGTGTGTFAGNIDYMNDLHIKNVVVEKLQHRADAGGSNKRYITGQLTDHVAGRPVKLYFLESVPPLTSVTFSSISSGNPISYNSNYRLGATLQYNSLTNLVQETKTDDAPTSYIWDYNYTYPVAAIKNAGSDESSYTSFETSYKGGFTFSGTAQTGGITGKRYHTLTSQSITGGANPAKAYIVSYWSSTTTPYTVSGSGTAIQGPTRNNWTYFEHVVSGVGTVTISGTGNIDELRLYPGHAQMTTQTYDPLIGITSQAGVSPKIVYYEYDGLNRLLNIRDDDGNIVKNYSYNYGLGTAPTASAASLWYNTAIDTSVTKQGCTGGKQGDIVTYKVPYGKHVSAISSGDAQSKATADLAANAQAYANAIGGCSYWNAAITNYPLFKNNCPPEKGPALVYYYTVPFGKYRSTVDQAAADALAVADRNTLGQAAANLYGTCECDGNNKKYISGNCEESTTKHWTGSISLGGGNYRCFFKWKFSDDSLSVYEGYEDRSSPCPLND